MKCLVNELNGFVMNVCLEVVRRKIELWVYIVIFGVSNNSGDWFIVLMDFVINFGGIVFLFFFGEVYNNIEVLIMYVLE